MKLSNDMILKLTLITILTIFLIWAAFFMANGGNDRTVDVEGLTLESVTYTHTDAKNPTRSKYYYLYREDGEVTFNARIYVETDGGLKSAAVTDFPLETSVMEDIADIARSNGGAGKLKNAEDIRADIADGVRVEREGYLLIWSDGTVTEAGRGRKKVTKYLDAIAETHAETNDDAIVDG